MFYMLKEMTSGDSPGSLRSRLPESVRVTATCSHDTTYSPGSTSWLHRLIPFGNILSAKFKIATCSVGTRYLWYLCVAVYAWYRIGTWYLQRTEILPINWFRT